MNTKKLSPQALQVKFLHMPQSLPIKELVRQQADRLRRFDLAEGRCEAVIDRMHRRYRGIVFKVSIRLEVPGKRLFVAHAEESSGAVGNLQAAVWLAFDEIERQLDKREKRNQRRQAA
ncbi:HPF/RaiA family ribosome-associated protein [Pontiella sulfatireligans]|uniref:Ribosomal subunit interface protein n=1 Tax=Pontiella sulfatireligans TaxID=2750658 RepID=A0A6C2UJ19_9BACT|nr:hypothetical protein SCARR_02276 [Pontiella sulfatireligans]